MSIKEGLVVFLVMKGPDDDVVVVSGSVGGKIGMDWLVGAVA